MKAKDLFARAHELEGEERETFLAKACKDNAELRLEVQRLLVQAEKADSFFGDTEGATIGAEEIGDTFTEAEGDVIGPYTLRQQIGEGGFGTVWMAEQSVPISRMVALKVIKAGMDTRQVLARFEAERQAVAMMDHPNIAKVLDAGATSTGRPYFAMELVKGIPITRFCSDQKYGPRRRLELFRDVCSAVSHAHQKGIIHRDLKPSNVMVTLHGDKPVVKVIDFGIAKATQNKLTDKTLFTRFEQFLGTPVYMSPEQAAMSGLDIDTRSDIYSLGVLLYELLAGAPPFDQKSLLSAGYDEMRRIIKEDEPPKPSTRLTQTQMERSSEGKMGSSQLVSASSLRGELDWIAMKAIEKDRSRRYETANAFSADIGRYLSDEPVEAGAPSSLYRIKKFARRHRLALAVAGVMTLLLLAGIAATGWQAVRARAAEDLATQRLQESETARAEAEAVSNFLTEMFESTRPGDAKGGREVKVADVLDRAAMKLGSDLSDQPATRASLRATLSSTYAGLGLGQEAMPLAEAARDYYLETFGKEDTRTLNAMSGLASCYQNIGRRDEALAIREEVLALTRKLLGAEHPDSLRALNALAHSYYEEGRLDGREERRDQALVLHEEILKTSRKVLGAKHPDTLLAIHNLAASYSRTSRGEEALEMQKELFKIRCEEIGPEHPQSLSAMANLASMLNGTGNREQALDMQKELLKLSRKVLGAHHPETLVATERLVGFYHDSGLREDALSLQVKIPETYRATLGPKHPNTIWSMQWLALTYQQAGKTELAKQMFDEVLAIRKDSDLSGGSILQRRDLVEMRGFLQHALSLGGEILWAGRTSEYEGFSRRLLALCATTKDALTMRLAAKLASLADHSEQEVRANGLSRARLALELAKKGEAEGWYRLAVGMAAFRNGLYPEAGGELEAVGKDKEVGEDAVRIAAFYRSMCLFHQGKEEDARKLFEVTAAASKPLPPEEFDILQASPFELILWLARKEAGTLLGVFPGKSNK